MAWTDYARFSILEPQHLIDQMKAAGYPDSTPILFTECFNMTPFRIPALPMAPVDLKPGTVCGLGVAVHDYKSDQSAPGGRSHATVSSATRPGHDLNRKPYLMPLVVLVE